MMEQEQVVLYKFSKLNLVAEGLDIYVPGNGIRFETWSITLDLTNVTDSVTIGYTG